MKNFQRYFPIPDLLVCMLILNFKQSIKDAVIVCRFLDIKCLWVDALCIVQDDIDERDWYEQSSQMGAVYSNAHFVISADAASCCTDGFLENHDQYNTWTPVSYSAADGVEVVELGCQSFKVPRVRGCAGNIQASALSRRGWAMQECILPHRILHFVGDEIVWECNTTCTCECNKTHLHGLWKHADFTLINDPRLQQEDEYANVHIDDFLRGRTTESRCWIWERLIERYSHRALTVSGDKLAAISGLTTLFQKYLEVELADYLAGIWKVDLPAGLLWYMSGSPAPSKPDRWRAPSWSWASMNGGIGFFNERYQFTFTPRITIIESVCKASPIDPLGKVSDGLIRLRGTLEPVTLTITRFKHKDLYNGQYQGSCGKPGRAYPDLMARVRKYGSSYEILPDMRIEAGTYFEKYYCLDIGRASNPLRLGKRTSWLVLRKTGDERGGIPCFERVGIGIFDSSSRGVSFFPASGHQGTELILV